MGFMMWMAGSTVHLFNIGITSSALWQPISHYNLSERVIFDVPYKDTKLNVFHLSCYS
ncbi:hypothetical protein Lalb_Chr01g0013281 [Lupinus albus]|uniref:ER membrane protein complex subunit 4 n=1 Tax=Lupinus albus TaxID=3870 RepID=A0A6A4R3F8_LUPAL|nr:hypothetical protein Lalb_Chr01g0013281 [Lupinus albus]